MFTRIITSALLAASVGLGGVTATSAAPVPAQPTVENGSAVLKIDHRRHHGFHRRDGHVYYNGERGYRERRSGYRYYNGYWFPAFAFSLFLAPQVVQPGTIHLTRAHYRWCDNRYRSYRQWDNSFQPYHGPRKQCVSPYMY